MVSGKHKGSSYERDIAKKFTEYWCEVPKKEKHIWRADMNQGGVPEYPGDLAQGSVCDHPELPFAVECKTGNKGRWRFKNLLADNNSSLLEWWDKIERQTHEHNEEYGKHLVPLMVFTKNRHPDYVMFKHSDICLFNPMFMYEREGVGKMDLYYIGLLDDFLNSALRRYLYEQRQWSTP